MATNRERARKIVVTKCFSGGGEIGWTDPKINMKVRHGQDYRWITGSGAEYATHPLGSGDFLVPLAMTSGGPVVCKAYPYQLQVESGIAQYFGYSLGNNSTEAGHSGIFRQGVPNVTGSGTWATWSTGNPVDGHGGVFTYTR